MDNRPVGFFDSGFGGLTALRAFRKLMPDENIIYFGDTGRMPYGARPAAQLRRMTAQDLDLLRGFGVKAIVSASSPRRPASTAARSGASLRDTALSAA